MPDDVHALSAHLIAKSPYSMSLDEANALIAERRAKLLAAPAVSASEPDFAPQPMPILDAPIQFGREFWARKSGSQKSRKSKPKTRPGRQPVGDALDERHGRFGVIDGEGGDNDSGTK